jgi:hypothetical protein
MYKGKTGNLSKSKYLKSLQCPRLLWVDANQRERIVIDESTQHIFAQGHEVGLLAQSLFPDGVDAGTGPSAENLALTAELLPQRVPIYEAGLSAGRLYCRADILEPAPGDAWDIIEVKSANSVKPENLDDVAFQRYCATMSGLTIRRCFLMHLNPDYVKQGDIDPEALFVTEDVTDQLDPPTDGIEGRIAEALQVMDADECPGPDIGARCSSPYACALTGECWDGLADHHPLTLYYGKALGERLLKQGINTIADIPPHVKLNGKQRIQMECVMNNRPYIDSAALGDFLGGLEYPLYFMDFETFQTAIPLYDGTRPYQQIPFQFSVHVVDRPGAEPRHHSFLADSPADPRADFIRELTACMGERGSVIVYYQTFETGRLAELAQAFPEYRERIANIVGRMADLIVPFRNFAYYHPDQRGRASLKYTMPALTGLGYSDLVIKEGGMASLRYFQSVFGNLPEAEVAAIRRDLETYCGQDTFGMIGMVEELRGLVTRKI